MKNQIWVVLAILTITLLALLVYLVLHLDRDPYQWLSISAGDTPSFILRGGTIDYSSGSGEDIVFPEVDQKSFQVSVFYVGTSTYYAGYAKDKNYVFYFAQATAPFAPANPDDAYEIPGADPKTFKVLYSGGDEADEYQFAEDVNHVYVGGDVVPDADPRTFQVILSGSHFSDYTKDRNHVYYDGVDIIPDADPSTFAVLADTGRYAKDTNHVYSIFDADQNLVPTIPVTITGADPQTFEALNETQIYTGNCGLNFPPSCVTDATDKNHEYFAGAVIN